MKREEVLRIEKKEEGERRERIGEERIGEDREGEGCQT